MPNNRESFSKWKTRLCEAMPVSALALFVLENKERAAVFTFNGCVWFPVILVHHPDNQLWQYVQVCKQSGWFSKSRLHRPAPPCVGPKFNNTEGILSLTECRKPIVLTEPLCRGLRSLGHPDPGSWTRSCPAPWPVPGSVPRVRTS